MTTGERIRQTREARGEQQVQLADILGCHKQVISNVERGQNNPSLELLCAIADHYRTSTDYLLCRTDDHWVSQFTTAANEDEADLLEAYRQMDKHQRRILLGKMEELLREEKI